MSHRRSSDSRKEAKMGLVAALLTRISIMYVVQGILSRIFSGCRQIAFSLIYTLHG